MTILYRAFELKTLEVSWMLSNHLFHLNIQQTLPSNYTAGVKVNFMQERLFYIWHFDLCQLAFDILHI